MRIIEAAMNAFREKVIRSVTMDDVAAELGISKRTLYEIFDKKEDLLFEGVKEMYRTRRSQMEVKLAHCENVMEIILAVYKMKVEDFRRTNTLFYTDMVKYPQVGQYLAQLPRGMTLSSVITVIPCRVEPRPMIRRRLEISLQTLLRPSISWQSVRLLRLSRH